MKKLLYLLPLLLLVAGCDKGSGNSDKIRKITFNEGSENIAEEEIKTISFTVDPPLATERINWIIENEDVATIYSMDESGRNVSFFGISSTVNFGTTKVTAVSESGKASAEFTLYVREKTITPTKIILSDHYVQLCCDQSMTLTAIILPEGAEYGSSDEISWKVLDENVVTGEAEDVNFYAEAVAPGKTQVEMTLGGLKDVCEIEVLDRSIEPIPVTGVSVGVQNYVTVSLGGTVDITASVLPINASNTAISWSFDGPVFPESSSGKHNMKFRATGVGNATVTVTSEENPSLSATKYINVKMPEVPEGAVDLGYRSSSGMPVFYATCNLGAFAPYELGDLYAWGDPHTYYRVKNPVVWEDGKSGGYVRENYKWYDPVTGKMTKYNGTDKKLALDTEDDPAHDLGSNWGTPTTSELYWLKTNCTWKFTQKDGVSGYLLTSKAEGYTSNSIFLPATGYFMDKWRFYGESGWTGDFLIGMYMSCNPVPNDWLKDAALAFSKQKDKSKGDIYVNETYREVGQAIRPVWRAFAR